MAETKHHTVEVQNIRMGHGCQLFLIAGPCVIEDEASTLKAATRLKEITGELGMPFIFKSSYDKANRMSASSFRGPGLEQGLEILRKVRDTVRVPVLSDVHSEGEAEDAARVLDVLQVPAFLCRQTDLVMACARTGKAVNIKKGQFLAPWDMKNIVDKAAGEGKNPKVMVTERGFSFGYNNLVSDMRSIPIMKSFGYPVIFDAGHSVQLPGGQGTSSGGMREMIPVLARAAVAAGCDGLFLEVHENPDCAPSDGPNMLKLSDLPHLIKELKAIRAALNGV